MHSNFFLVFIDNEILSGLNKLSLEPKTGLVHSEDCNEKKRFSGILCMHHFHDIIKVYGIAPAGKKNCARLVWLIHGTTHV